MFLHSDRELFENVVRAVSAEQKLPVSIIEKDYYVTMILKLLAEDAPECVFKGGTCLSKCYHAIDRFSEDIDITTSVVLSQGQRKKLKNTVVAGISKELELPVSNWDETRSRRDYNCYMLNYLPVDGHPDMKLLPAVKMEIVLGSISFPVANMEIDSYIYRFLSVDNMDIIEEYGLKPFSMPVQSLERTFIDKVFAICDYYLTVNIKRHSRHIYDLYMLFPKITFDDNFRKLVTEVRKQRMTMSVCPSAAPEVSIPELLEKIADCGVYRNDYVNITAYFQNYPVEYEKVIGVIDGIIETGCFE